MALDFLNNTTVILVAVGALVLFVLYKWLNAEKENSNPGIYRKMRGEFLID